MYTGLVDRLLLFRTPARRSLALRSVLLVALLAYPGLALAQEATITGTVTDTTGGVLPGVTVTAVHEASGVVLEAVTDERGVFRMPVRIGAYRLTASLPGFQEVTRAGVPVAVGQTVTVALQMGVTGLAETVTVTGEAPLINVTSSSLGTNITQAQMENLPVQGRNWQQLAMLAVGNTVNDVTEGDREIAVEGSGSYQVNVDGQQITYYGGGNGDVQARFSRDAIAEFEFISNRFDATQGRSSGIQVNAVTRGGTNTPSGFFGGYFRDDSWNAADHVTNRKLPYSNQQLSAGFGGPIVRDRLHYFANYEFEHEPSTFVWQTPYPEFNLEFTGARREHKVGGRVDYQFSPQTSLSMRGSYWNYNHDNGQEFAPEADNHPSVRMKTFRESNNALGTVTRVISNSAVNVARVGWAFVRNREYPHAFWADHPNGPPNDIWNGAPNFIFDGYSVSFGNSLPQNMRQGNLSARNDFSTSFNRGGRHDLRIGGEYILNFWKVLICRNCHGSYDAQAGPIDSLPLSLPEIFPVWHDATTWNLNAVNPLITRYQIGIGNNFQEVDRHVWAGWFQDDWRMTDKFTLNLGVRYDFALNAHAEKVNFEPWLSNAPRPAQKDRIQPRLGFAYQLTDRTVLRGGFGKYYGEVTNMSAHGTLAWRDVIGVEIFNDGRPDFASNPFNGPMPTHDDVIPLTCWDQAQNQGGARPGCIRRQVANNLANPSPVFPHSWQTSLGFQRQIGQTMAFEADYVYSIEGYGIVGGNINQSWNPETGLPYSINNLARRPFPEWAAVNMRRNLPGMHAQDHSVQMGFQKRLSDRWQGSATYLLFFGYQKDYPIVLPEMVSIPQTHGGCTHPVTWNASVTEWNCHTPVNFGAYGVDIVDQNWYRNGAQMHRFQFNAIYQLPYEFQVSGLYFYGDNGRVTTTSGVDIFQVGGVVANRTRRDGSIIPRWNFNQKDLHRVDLRVYRSFTAGGTSFEPMLEVYNLFNRANFTAWTLNESNANFGRPSDARGIAYGPRVIQLGFRARF